MFLFCFIGSITRQYFKYIYYTNYIIIVSVYYVHYMIIVAGYSFMHTVRSLFQNIPDSVCLSCVFCDRCVSLSLTLITWSLFQYIFHIIIASIFLWYYGITLTVRVSVRLSYIRPSVFLFWTTTGLNLIGFSPNLVCALILWRSGLGLLVVRFVIFSSPELKAQDELLWSLTVRRRRRRLPYVRPSVHNL